MLQSLYAIRSAASSDAATGSLGMVRPGGVENALSPRAGSDLAATDLAPSRPQRPRPKAAASSARSWQHGRFAAYAARPLGHVAPLLFVAGLAATAYVGRIANEEGHLTAEHGVGYWLGIAGSLAMLALLLYPLRKRFGASRWLGSVAWWFRAHMMLGLIGPALILVHCNFKPGSLNSTVALVCMLLVAGSGLVGRYLYGRVHMGLYGRKALVQDILADRDALQAALGEDMADRSDLAERLEAHAAENAAASLPARLLLLSGRSRRLRRRLERDARRIIGEEARRLGWSRKERRSRQRLARSHLRLYFAAADKAAALAVYDRLLSMWHVAHLPMFLLLVIAAIVHVVAVHLY